MVKGPFSQPVPPIAGDCLPERFLPFSPKEEPERGMQLKQSIIELETTRREALYDITEQVRAKVEQSGINNGLVSIYA